MSTVEQGAAVVVVWALFIAYVVKSWVFSTLAGILKDQGSVRPLGIALHSHYRWIKRQSIAISVLVFYLALRTMDVWEKNVYISVPLYVVCIYLAAMVSLSGVRLKRIAVGDDTIETESKTGLESRLGETHERQNERDVEQDATEVRQNRTQHDQDKDRP